MRQIITELLSDTRGISAVEDGIALGVFGAMFASVLPGYGLSFGIIFQSMGKFLGLL
ncbi:MAG TPA: hypothetical protein VG328_13000 [Stellaceae bacterium]|jgi:hypothetical protein|nr:hypothetical protein [Stellaceae bacterium]